MDLNKNKQQIHILKMGGTIEFIDPAYEIINQQMMKFDTSIENYLNNMVKPHFDFKIDSICEKDSRAITDEDMTKLAEAVLASESQDILITHGTFTMRKTALFLEQYFSGKKDFNKKVILTGSMVPIVGFSLSDAAFNLGYSIASFNSVEPGVYISMNGGVFKAAEVDKNVETLRFE